MEVEILYCQFLAKLKKGIHNLLYSLQLICYGFLARDDRILFRSTLTDGDVLALLTGERYCDLQLAETFFLDLFSAVKDQGNSRLSHDFGWFAQKSRILTD